MILSFIVATSRNGIIGHDSKIPWRVPSDLEHFKSYTNGKTLLMGRKTFESIPGLLRNRRVIVLTRSDSGLKSIQNKVNDWKSKNSGQDPPEIMVCNSFSELFHNGPLEGLDELVVCGGGAIYDELYPYCDKLVHTLIDVKLVGDTLFAPSHKVNLATEWVRNDKESFPEKRGEYTRGTNDEYRYYINSFYRPFTDNVYSFSGRKKVSKLEQMRSIYMMSL